MSEAGLPPADSHEPWNSFPEPKQERWQPLRGGLLNLYRFDEQEFHFEQGRLLLRGNNGTGKSRVLALQLPFLLDGDVSPSRFEPDGDPNKRAEWNLLLGKYDDRLGYTWLEFGRRDEDGSLHYLTLGCGLRAVEKRGLVGKWFFVTPWRVRQDFHLQTSAGQPLTRDRLIETLGDRGEVFETATEYRQAVDRCLFGLGERRYSALVEALIRLRQPQLTRQFDEKKLSDALSEALPPVSDGIIADVAESFRGLENERTALEAFVAARRGADAFLEAYQRYGKIAARRRAETVRTTHYEYESTMRRLREAESQLSSAQKELERTTAELQQLSVAERVATSRVTTLLESPEMRTARALDEARQLAKQREEEAAGAQEDLDRLVEARKEKEEQQAEAEKHVSLTRSDAEKTLDEALKHASKAGLGESHRGVFESLDWQTLSDDLALPSSQQRLSDAAARRLEAADHIRRLNGAVEQAHNALSHEKEMCARLVEQLDSALERQEEGQAAARRAKTDLLQGYSSWFQGLRELRPPLPSDIVESVEAWCETGEGENPIVALAGRAAHEVLGELSEERARLQGHLQAIDDQLAELRRTYERIEQGWHEPPPPPHTRDIASRESRPGGPLWLLCDFAPELPTEQRPGIEAALEASGLLDAWITPDGRLLAADEQDTVLVADTSPLAPDDRHVGRALVPSVDRNDPQTVAIEDGAVSTILRHIGLGRDAGSVWVDFDGRWQVGPLHGAWSKPYEQHVGPGARETERQRRLQTLAREMAEHQREQDAIGGELDSVADREKTVQGELSRAPDGTGVMRAQAEVAAKIREVQECRQKVTEQETRVSQKRQELETATIQRDRDARDLKVTDWLDDLESLKDAIHSYMLEMAALWPKVRSFVTARKSEQEAGRRTTEAVGEEVKCRGRLLELQVKAKEAAARGDTLEATVGATAQHLEEQLADARQQLESIRKGREQLTELKANTKAGIVSAEKDIAAEKGKLEESTTRRDRAIDDLRRFAETGLLALAVPGLIVGPVSSEWSATRAVEIARRAEGELANVDSDDAAWDRNQKGIYRHIEELKECLLPYGHHPTATPENDVFVVTASFRGKECNMAEFRDALSDEIEHHRTLLDAREREVLENHLIGEVAMHLHERLHDAEQLVLEMNEEITSRPTSTGMTLRFVWEPIPDGPPGLAEARRRLLGAGETWSQADRESLGAFLQRQIQMVRLANETGTWQEHLAAAFDYRRWHQFAVERQQDGNWKRLTRRTHGTGSGGEKVIALTIPQFAAAAAHYRSAGKFAPRLILLDEAYVGVDADARMKCMDLLRAFDLDFVMTSEREWGCYPTVPRLAIYQLATRPGIDAVGVTRWVWNGRQRIRDERPDRAQPVPLTIGAQETVGAEDGSA